MTGYRDPGPLARAAIGWTWIWVGAQLLHGLASARVLALMVETASEIGASFDSPPPELSTFDFTRVIAAFVVIVSFVVGGLLILRWIHAVNANAHLYSGGMNVGPGWNVGFFFVPIANLWKPFQGLSETWQASNSHSPGLPIWVRWWWGLWLVSNLIFGASFWMGFQANTFRSVSVDAFLDILSAIVSLPLALLLIRLIRSLTAAQETMQHGETFA